MRRALTALAVALILVLQFVIPSWSLLSEGRSRFAWQMYAETGPRVEFRVNTPAGQVVMSPRDVGGHRIEVDYMSLSPPQICVRTEAKSVEVWVSGSLHSVMECP